MRFFNVKEKALKTEYTEGALSYVNVKVWAVRNAAVKVIVASQRD